MHTDESKPGEMVQDVHVMSHCGCLIFCRAELGNSACIKANFFSVAMKKEGDKLSLASSLSWYPQDDWEHMIIECADCINLRGLNLKLPALLVRGVPRQKKQSSRSKSKTAAKDSYEIRLLYIYHDNFHELCNLSYITNLQKEKQGDLEFMLLDGPVIVLHDKQIKCVYFSMPMKYDQRSFTLQEVVFSNCSWQLEKSEDLRKLEPTKLIPWSLWTRNANCRLYAWLHLQGSHGSEYCFSTLKEDSSSDGSSSLSAEVSHSPLPKAYWSIITAFVIMSKMSDISREFKKFNVIDDNFFFTVVATTYEQLLVFDSANSYSIFSAKIPCGDCSAIIYVKLPGDGYVFVLKSTSEGCFVLSLKSKKILKHWNSAKDVFIGDFLRVGHEQILVILSYDESHYPSEFIITDLSCCQMDSSEHNSATSPEVKDEQKSMSSVIDALSSSLQASLIQLRDLRVTCTEKKALTEETWRSMKSMVYCKSAPTTEEHLVSLFDREMPEAEAETGRDFMKPTIPEAEIEILDIWKRIVFDQLVVGVNIRNILNTSLRNVSLCLLEESVISRSAVQFSTVNKTANKDQTGGISARLTSDSVIAKKLKKDDKQATSTTDCVELKPDQTAILTASCCLPDFEGSHNTKLSLFITYLKDERAMWDFVDHITLNAEEVVSGKYNIQSTRCLRGIKDQIAFEAVAVQMKVAVRTRFTSLHYSLPVIICNYLRIPKENIDSNNPQKFTEIIDNDDENMAPQLEESELTVDLADTYAEITVFSKNVKTLLRVLQCLRKYLPDDAEMIPITKAQSKGMEKLLASQLQYELGIQRVPKCAEDKPISSDADKHRIDPVKARSYEERVSIVRQEFSRKRKLHEAALQGQEFKLSSLLKEYQNYLLTQIDTDKSLQRIYESEAS